MGFSTSGATVILFLGMLISASVLYPAVDGSYEQIRSATNHRNDRVLNQRNSAIEIANVTYNATSNTLNVTANNTGAITLGVEAVDLLVDGRLQTTHTVSVDGVPNRTLWQPGEALTLSVSGVTTAPSRVKVVAGTGIAKATTNVTVV